MDRATLPHTQLTILLYTELDTDCDQQAMTIVQCWKHFAVFTSR